MRRPDREDRGWDEDGEERGNRRPDRDRYDDERRTQGSGESYRGRENWRENRNERDEWQENLPRGRRGWFRGQEWEGERNAEERGGRDEEFRNRHRSFGSGYAGQSGWGGQERGSRRFEESWPRHQGFEGERDSLEASYGAPYTQGSVGYNPGGYGPAPWQRYGESGSWETRGQMGSDWSGASTYKGKGPKGYRRADDRIEEEINHRLTEDPRLDASEIECSVTKGEVTLSGSVPDKQMKRLAEDCVERVFGVDDVQNNIRVKKETDHGDGRQRNAGSQTQVTGSKSRV